MATRPMMCLTLVLISLATTMHAATGDTRVCKWKDDKEACYTFVFDDGCPTQLDIAVPEFVQRGWTCATFWLNPGARHFTLRVAEWVALVDQGFDFANHGMDHTGGSNYDECDYQVGEAAKRIRTWNKKPFMLWHQGGGTEWPITDAQKVELLVKHGVYPHWDQPGRGLGTRDGGNTNRSAATLRGYIDNCLADGGWHWTLFHGIGGDWVVQDRQAFIDMLDYMQTKEDRMWYPTCTNAHKYLFERLNSELSVVAASAQQIELTLEFAALDCAPVDESYLDPAVYDMPLTLVTDVPDGWAFCQVTQGGAVSVHEVSQGAVMYEARPGMGPIVLTESDGTPVGRDMMARMKPATDTQPRLTVHTTNDIPSICVFSQHSHRVSIVDGRGGLVARFDGTGRAVYRLAVPRLAAGTYVVRADAGGRTTGVPLVIPGTR
ncbi:MAG: hypothetical protein GF331_27210 [Chitinivibrionales bacterium]|nr:hypothetical protein [Chitinivibrionales bacterium]